MDLVFDIVTSLEFWRRVYPLDRIPKPPGQESVTACAYSLEDVRRLTPKWADSRFLEVGDGRLHVMAFDAAQRRKSKEHVVHIWSGPVPPGAFYRLNDSVLVASPSFIFLVAATMLNLPELIAFGCELCGRYSFDPNEKRGFRTRTKPLLTPERLGVFLAGARDCRGYRKAASAFSHVIGGAASPMETFDALAMCLPYRLGGYGLPVPIMNKKVELSKKAARIAKRSVCYADMCYCDEDGDSMMLDIEHHGKLDHSSEEDQASDRARVNGLKEMGFEVIELTKDQVNDLMAYEYIIRRIARLLGKRIRKDKLGPIPSRIAFRKEVFAWNKSNGRLLR